MSFMHTAMHHPRRLAVRRVLFQVHLWLGLLLALWVVLIGVSGSVLVYEAELDRVAFAPVASASCQQLPLPAALHLAAAANPGRTPAYIIMPSPKSPFFEVWLREPAGAERMIATDPCSGASFVPRHPLLLRALRLTHDFHTELLAGPRGEVVNGVLSLALLLVALSGVALWWHGIRNWTRGLRISLRTRPGHRFNWRRFNFDLHHAVGIWTLGWSLMWAVSGAYFGFPVLAEKIANRISQVRTMHPPPLAAEVPPGALSQHPVSIDTALDRARAVSTGTFLSGVSLPAPAAANYVFSFDTAQPGDFSHRDFVTVSPRTGQVLSVWHYGRNQSWSDCVLWALYPMHYGMLWGPVWQALWAVLGLSLPVLAVTGACMYWNRFLRRFWRTG